MKSLSSPIPASPAASASPLPLTVTKTGAVVGTPAYMAPEQFRRETLDARADQFSFCVALHEALHGQRPALAHLRVWPERPTPHDRHGEPEPPDGRADVVAGRDRARAVRRSRRPVSVDGRAARRREPGRSGAGASGRPGWAWASRVALLAVGAWRLADARRVSCAPPTDRLAAVWSGDESNPRRQAVHRAFTGLGRSTAETAWQQVARALDDYAAQWSAMYVQTCEATNVRGEQSGEVLDLRMGCLSEALDGARALTEVLSRADQQTMLSQTVTAAQDLPPLGRCADVAALRSAVPLPRDEKTAEAVRGLQRSLRDANVAGRGRQQPRRGGRDPRSSCRVSRRPGTSLSSRRPSS